MKNILFLIISLMFLSLTAFSDPGCTSEIYNGKEIKYCFGQTDWKGAQAECRMMNMNLLTDYDMEIDGYIYTTLKNLNTGLSFWIGLNDIETEGTFVWDSGLNSGFNVWGNGEPDNFEDEDCVIMDSSNDYLWADKDCFSSNAYICEGDIQDDDNDGIPNNDDNCPNVANPSQADIDSDTLGDACDDDNDNDLILNDVDNCPFIANEEQEDTDNDNIGDTCDNCSTVANPDQLNSDENTVLLMESVKKGEESEQISYAINMDNDSFGNIYIPDSQFNKVNKYDKSGNYISSISIDSPTGIHITHNDSIYVCEVMTHKVKKFNTSGVLLSEFTASLAENRLLISIYVTNTNIYLISIDMNQNENAVMQKYDLTGTFEKEWEIPTLESIGIAFDSQNNMYVTDDIQGKLYVYDTNGTLINQWIDNPYLIRPVGIEIDADDNIYISNAGSNSVDMFDLNGNFIKHIVNNLSTPFDIILNNNNSIYILSNSEVNLLQKYSLSDTLGDACDDDKDNDGLLNTSDNCELIVNSDQLNSDDDETGDACDEDIDNDLILNIDDNCVYIQNETQIDIDEDEIGDECDDNYCSLTQLNGQCREGKLCDNGLCVDYVYNCSPLHTDGVCFDGKECVEGVCTDIYYECSSEHTDGYCEQGKICNNGECVEAIYVCSTLHTNGYCESGYECIDGSCVKVDTVTACSPAHADGYCEYGYDCIEGVCVISDNNNNSSGSDDGCSYMGTETRRCLVSTEIFMLFIMMIGLYIKRKSL